MVKDSEGRAAMNYFKRPRTWRDGKPVFRDDPVRFAALARYCQQDVRIERQLMRQLPRLQELDRPVFEQDLRINLRGMLIDPDLIRIGGTALVRALAAANQKIQALTDGKVRGVTKCNDIVAFLRANDVELVRPEEAKAVQDATEQHQELLHRVAIEPEDIDAAAGGADSDEIHEEEKPSDKGALTKAAVITMLERDNLPEKIRQVLEIRQEYGRTSTAKLRTVAGTLDPGDGRTRDYLTYHAASTGRAGGRLMQPQNLPRDSVPPEEWAWVVADLHDLSPEDFIRKHKQSPVAGIVRLIRGGIIAPPEYTLAGGDFSKIELVVGAWLVGAEELLDDLRKGVDTYVQMAAGVYDIPIAAVDPDTHRQVGKATMLGAIFGLGALTFKAYVLASTRITIDEVTAQRTITLFRARYPEFPAAWRETGRAALRAVLYPGTAQPCLGGRVIFRCTPHRDWLTATLPSGRRLRYCRPNLNEEINRFGNRELVLRSWGVSSRTHQWTNEIKHGALLFENLTQAIARDLLMSACLRLEHARLPVVLHVHDEVLSEVPLSRGITPRDIHTILTQRPSWAADMPIDAECWVSPRYGKVDKEKIKPEEAETP
jgi:DNA polymerase